jgi:hypothetical protein
MGEFAIRPQQGAVRAIFVSLKRLQKDIEQPGKVNTILLSETDSMREAHSQYSKWPDKSFNPISSIIRDTFTLEDLGIKLRALDAVRGISIESESAIITDEMFQSVETAAARSNLTVSPVLSYLANTIRINEREIPYSLVTAVDARSLEALTQLSVKPDPNASATDSQLPRIILNEWAASDLDAKPGDEVTLDYYVWKDDGRLATESARFRLAAVVAIKGAAADRDLVPDYPGTQR